MTPAAPLPIVSELVLVGGGHTHALVLRMWAMRPVPGVRLTLVHPGPTAPYSGMLPGHVAGHFDRDALEIDLVRLARVAGARLLPEAATALDPAARILTLGSGRRVGYDLLSLDVGITAEMPGLPGFAAHGVPAKPLGPFAASWEAALARGGPAAVAILGGGVAGAELAMACAHRLRGAGRRVPVTLVDRGSALAHLAPAARRHVRAALDGWGVALAEGRAPAAVTAAGVTLEDGTEIAADLVIAAAGATPHPWLAASGLATAEGFVAVGPDLRSLADPRVFAAGDCAHLAHDPRPKAGVYAVRAAPVLAHNLRAALTGGRLRVFRPQRDFLKLISLGDRRAVAEKGGRALGGALAPALWHWKRRIDTRFMARFADLPAMAPPPPPRDGATGLAEALAGPAPCGGCGAKLGADALATALAARPGPARPDLAALPGDDAARIRLGDRTLVISSDHLRGFALDPALVARVAAVHALGDIWAMGAAPQAALATVILPRLAPRLQGAWLDEVMAAATYVFAAEGAAVIGGHSSMGAELTLGFTVTGLPAAEPITLAGARPGDALVLSRPLGTGVLLAAEMRGAARGADVLACWQALGAGQGPAARALAPVARAMTDVTGFGLAGHAWNLCRASGTGAEIALDALPFFAGAEALAARGIASTLLPQNRAALDGILEAPDTPRAALCLDPQTAGGLLAAVPAAAVDPLRAALAAEGVALHRVGTVTDRPGRLVLA